LADQARLAVQSVATGYGRQQVLSGVSIEVRTGKIVALIGHNGSGKSTLLKVIFRLLPLWAGQVLFEGADLATFTPERLLGAGIAYIPQGNRIFPSLSVRENLQLGAHSLKNRARCAESIEQVLTMFPALKGRFEQRAGTLSGGEKQMLALGNALVVSPRLLLLDEPSLGLSPALVNEALNRVQQISRETGASVLIVEQKIRQVLHISEWVYVLRNGAVHFSGPSESLSDESLLKEVYL
jgi:branched-chain amino acid transport system ATP-binding protein